MSQSKVSSTVATRPTSTDRVPLQGGWTLWPWFCVRGAGFPVADVLKLGAPSTAAALAKRVEAEDAVREASATVIVELQAILDARASDDLKPIGRSLRAVRAGRLPRADWVAGYDIPALDTLKERATELETTIAELERVAVGDDEAIVSVLRTAAANPRFREAVTWQNLAAIRTAVDRVARDEIQTNAKARRRLQLVASYFQRYTTKNDSIGFFGPIGWGAFSDGAGLVSVRSGDSLLSKRRVYFEHWCMDALAATFSRSMELLVELPPRLAPKIWLEGDTLLYPVGKERRLPSIVAAILTLVDGVTPARAIAETLVADPGQPFDDVASVFEVLDELAQQGLVFWTLEVPTATPEPERELEHALSTLPSVADGPRAALAELASLRDDVARAAGDADALATALQRLGTRFEEITGKQSTRGAGQTYAGRTLVYESCVRDLDFQLGPEASKALAGPFELICASARWFTHEIARRYRAAFRERYDALVAERGTEKIDFVLFWERAKDLFSADGAESPIVDEVAATLRERWASLLGLPATDELELQSAELASEVARLFEAPGPGWPAARHHSPDVLLGSVNGGYRFVIGEIHVAINTVTLPFLAGEHPDFDTLVEARGIDLPEAHIGPVKSKHKTRADFYSILPDDFDLEVGDSKSPRDRSKVVSVGSLRVEEVTGSLRVRSRDGRFDLDIIAFVEQYLIAECHSRFDIVRPAPTCPRVSIDGVVVSRKRWRVEPDEIELDGKMDKYSRFAAIIRWARAKGIPRHVFVKSDAEIKPIYIDFESPFLLQLFGRIATQSSELLISEMLPTIEQCWLPGPDGERYTSELRLVAVDPIAWQPPTSE